MIPPTTKLSDLHAMCRCVSRPLRAGEVFTIPCASRTSAGQVVNYPAAQVYSDLQIRLYDQPGCICDGCGYFRASGKRRFPCTGEVTITIPRADACECVRCARTRQGFILPKDAPRCPRAPSRTPEKCAKCPRPNEYNHPANRPDGTFVCGECRADERM